MEYIKEITLDVYQDRIVEVEAKQGDTARGVEITVTAHGAQLIPAGSPRVCFRARKPDGHGIDNPAEITEKNTIKYKFTAQTVACPGRFPCDVYFVQEDGVLATVTFWLIVHHAPAGDEGTSSNEYGTMIEATDKALEAADAANDAAANANGSSGAADEAEAKRAAAEALRVQAEQARQDAETLRDTAEQDRAAAEALRAQAETDRAAAEQARQAAEALRAQAETDRAAAEQDRAAAEALRAENETARQDAENERDTAEQGRVDAEATRVEAEQQRVDEHTTAMEKAGEATQEALDAAKEASGAADLATHPPIIQNGTWWTWDVELHEYTDTGETAWGNILYAAFWLDPVGGDLYMYTDDAYDGPGFELNKNGELEVVLNAGETP
nr:hypothetical protein [uncultured Dysosmobacter sp.]